MKFSISVPDDLWLKARLKSGIESQSGFTRHKARKDYKCIYCGGNITEGEYYYRLCEKVDGDMYVGKCHDPDGHCVLYDDTIYDTNDYSNVIEDEALVEGHMNG